MATICYELKTAKNIDLAIYNTKGELVKTLFNGDCTAGHHRINFDAAGLNSELFFCKLEIEGRSIVSKMLFCK